MIFLQPLPGPCVGGGGVRSKEEWPRGHAEAAAGREGGEAAQQAHAAAAAGAVRGWGRSGARHRRHAAHAAPAQGARRPLTTLWFPSPFTTSRSPLTRVRPQHHLLSSQEKGALKPRSKEMDPREAILRHAEAAAKDGRFIDKAYAETQACRPGQVQESPITCGDLILCDGGRPGAGALAFQFLAISGMEGKVQVSRIGRRVVRMFSDQERRLILAGWSLTHTSFSFSCTIAADAHLRGGGGGGRRRGP